MDAMRAVAAFPWKPENPILPQCTLDSNIGPPSIFFNKPQRATVGFKCVKNLGVGLIGDSLMEPFWPQGLGLARGFLSCMDLVHALSTWFKTGNASQAETEHRQAYKLLKNLNGRNNA